MKVSYERKSGPEWMLPAMRVTQGKDMYKKKLPKLETWFKMILSEHSTSRVVDYRVFIEDIPYYSHTQLVRHSLGFLPYVKSQRDDKGWKEVTARDELPQGALVDMFFDANIQGLINIARKRSCYKSHRTVQNVISKLKLAMESGDAYDQLLGSLLMKPCSWFPGYCAEPEPCGRIAGVRPLHEVHEGILKGIQDGM